MLVNIARLSSPVLLVGIVCRIDKILLSDSFCKCVLRIPRRCVGEDVAEQVDILCPLF